MALHAEQNAIIYADREDLIGSTLYITCEPCDGCLRLISGSGVLRVIWPDGSLQMMNPQAS